MESMKKTLINNITTDKAIFKTDILTLSICLGFVLIEFFQRGIIIYVTVGCTIAYFLTACIVTLTNCAGNNPVRPTISNPLWNPFWNKTLNLTQLCLIASLTTSLLGHTPSLEYFKYLLLPLLLVVVVNYYKLIDLLKASKAIALYLLYCLWILLALWVSKNQSPLQVEFYLIIGAHSLILALLIYKGDMFKKALGYTLALAVILTTYQRGINEIIDPPGLMLTYKNMAALLGVMAIVILISLKPKNSFSPLTTMVIATTSVAIFLTPSQAGKLTLLIVTSYALWLYSLRLSNKTKLLKKVILTLGLATIIASSVGVTLYHKEISKHLGKKETLGGRTTIWEVTYDWIKLSPTTGNGGNFWFNQGGSAASNHHHEYVNRGYNGFIDSLVQSGFLGLVLLIALIVALVVETRLRWGEKTLLFLVTVLSLITETHSFSGTFLIVGSTTTRALLIFWLAYCISQSVTPNKPKLR